MEYKIKRSDSYLEHHGILGQKWGIRRYQNPDGSLTPEGKKRYSKDLVSTVEKSAKHYKGLVPSYHGLEREGKKLKNNRLIDDISKRMSPQLAAAKSAEDRIFRLSDDTSEEEATRAIYVANKIGEKWRANLHNELSDIFVNNTSNLSTETVELGR